ncbi:MAG: YebC/PmpR family DNA-binding transcriptional regulator [Defluviitaleaceae bacterium]|nr:YebC/PmpR family DNA-binding transcriptional regulator [Defluviitaleaceae bacterium]
MAGHSKFANIKHRKGKNDAAKGRVFTRLGRELAMAVKHGGGGDPASNMKLRDAIAKAKSENMPNDSIERSIKKAAGDVAQVNFEAITYEGYGPGGVAIIIKVLTDNRNRAAASVRNAFTKGNGNMGTPGCVAFMFDEVGQIMIETNCGMDEESLMLLTVDAGADDFIVQDGGYEVLTAVDGFSVVREALESANIPMISAEVTMLPQTYSTLTTSEELKSMNKLLDLLDDEDDVQNVYHNWEA